MTKSKNYMSTSETDRIISRQSRRVLPVSQESEQDEIRIEEKLSNSRFPIFIAYSTNLRKYVALKMFSHEDEKLNESYLNEARFQSLDHPNIIKIVDTVNHKEIENKVGDTFDISYILMELARCDFLEIMKFPAFVRDEKLVRTYFHQFIKGLEYLHSQGIVHLDLKPENILLGEDCNLKITDFDLSYKKGDEYIFGKGSINFRAPEMQSNKFSKLEAADIYSAGIVLFSMMVGYMPYIEGETIQGFDLHELLLNEPESFWKAFSAISNKKFNEDFKELFVSMTRRKVKERATLDDIKKSKWFQGEIYKPRELKSRMDLITNY